MSEEMYTDINDIPNVYTNTWPPTEEEIKNIASSALNQSKDKLVKVLVYWDNPKLMIFDPFHYANTPYINRKYKCNERMVEVVVGKED
jgi:hypothetical protein